MIRGMNCAPPVLQFEGPNPWLNKK